MTAIEFSPDPFPPLAADHPAVGTQCSLCGGKFASGDVTGPVPVPFVIAARVTPEQSEAECADGNPFELYVRYQGQTQRALLVHLDCAVHVIANEARALLPQMPPLKNFERLIEERFTLDGLPMLLLACAHSIAGPNPDIPTLEYAVCPTCIRAYRAQLAEEA